jgi:hypothetical protein
MSLSTFWVIFPKNHLVTLITTLGDWQNCPMLSKNDPKLGWFWKFPTVSRNLDNCVVGLIPHNSFFANCKNERTRRTNPVLVDFLHYLLVEVRGQPVELLVRTQSPDLGRHWRGRLPTWHLKFATHHDETKHKNYYLARFKFSQKNTKTCIHWHQRRTSFLLEMCKIVFRAVMR